MDQRLLPRIISGTSAGAVVAAVVCVCDPTELERRLEGGLIDHVVFRKCDGIQGRAMPIIRLARTPPVLLLTFDSGKRPSKLKSPRIATGITNPMGPFARTPSPMNA